MLLIQGIPVARDDAAWLVERLYQDASGLAVAAALIIENGIDQGLSDVALGL